VENVEIKVQEMDYSGTEAYKSPISSFVEKIKK